MLKTTTLAAVLSLLIAACGGMEGEPEQPADQQSPAKGKADDALPECSPHGPLDALCGTICPDGYLMDADGEISCSCCPPPPPPQTCGPFPGGACSEGWVCDLHSCGLGATGECVVQGDACPMVLDPVCGCDGVTYDNDCFRLLAGAALDHLGACGPQPRGCQSNDDCAEDAYCEFGDGVCLWPTFDIMEGECKTRPEFCPMVLAPVCGCDGQTYDNDCAAHAAGTSVAKAGACQTPPPPPPPPSCGPFPGGDCPTGMICDLQSCGIGGSGQCVLRPNGCPKHIDPVCGCDGATYDNDCMRLMAGVALDHVGACQPQPPKCWGNDDCDATEYCEFGDGACMLPTFSIMEGECKTRPEFCPMLLAPVCGCDGQTYDNDCWAHAAGTSVAESGSCSW